MLMIKRFFRSLGFLLLAVVLTGAVSTEATAQAPITPVKPTQPTKPEPQTASTSVTSPGTGPRRRHGQVSFDVPHNVEIALGNRSTGQIRVTGWDRDAISARAVSQRGDEVVIMGQSTDGPEMKLFLKADYADLEGSDPAAQSLDSPPLGSDGPIQIHLEVSLPRSAIIQVIRVFRSSVQISNVDTPLTIVGDQSLISLKQVGPVEVHTKSGNVEISEAKGLIEVTTTSGAIQITNAKGGVRAVSIAGPIEVRCAHGRVDVSNTNAPIDLYNVDGDVDAIGASSSVSFSSELQEGGRYYLKSMSGKVEMKLPANTAGFNATLSSYRGVVESEFRLKSSKVVEKEISRDGDKEIRRRISGQFGRGGPQIMLDSFEGLVRLVRVANPPAKTCK